MCPNLGSRSTFCVKFDLNACSSSSHFAQCIKSPTRNERAAPEVAYTPVEPILAKRPRTDEFSFTKAQCSSGNSSQSSTEILHTPFIYPLAGIGTHLLFSRFDTKTWCSKSLANQPWDFIFLCHISLCQPLERLDPWSGLRQIGVNLPTHFMIRPLLGEVEILVDAFNQGKVMFVEDAEELLQKHYGPGTTVTIDRTFFQDNAVRNRNFLTRMLTNLKQVRLRTFAQVGSTSRDDSGLRAQLCEAPHIMVIL